MKSRILFAVGTLTAVSLLAAEADLKETVSNAAKKLGEKDNYAWKTSNEFGNFTSGAEGKAEKDGLVQLSLSFNDTTTLAFLKTGKGAVKAPDEDWQSLADLAAAAENDPGPRTFLVRRLQIYKAPALQAADLAGKTKQIKKEEEVYSGDLTEAGAKELLSFGRKNSPGPKNAKGSVKFWIKDGQLAKYQIKLEGTVNFGGDDQDLEGTITIEIKNVGSSKIDMPEAAKKKMA